MGLRNGVRVAPVGLSPGTHAAGLLVVAIAVGMFSFSVLVIVHVQCRVILGDKYHHVLMLYWREIHQSTRCSSFSQQLPDNKIQSYTCKPEGKISPCYVKL
jgi:hypothetical protein